MKNIQSVFLPVILAVAVTAPEAGAKGATMITEVPFNCVRITDRFWAPRIEINRTVSITSAFHECEVNGRFDNFAIAAGLKEGEHRGDFSFDDTDPYKIIEGASYSLAVRYDRNLDAYLDSVITLIAGAQEPDGYLTTCVTNRCTRLSGWWGTKRWEKINSHELYNCGHLYEAAVAHYRATGKRTLLDVAIKNADLVCEVFGPGEGQKHVPSGHPIVEMALAKLYKVTGDGKYLRTAKYFVEEAGRGTDGHRLSPYSQDHKPVLDQDEIVGHAVRAAYLYSGVADVAALTGDAAYSEALARIWNSMASRKLYITGGIGSRAQGEGFGPDYELNNHTAYCETCAAIANVYWNHRMFLASGESKYVDVYELALYNGVLSGVSLSGDRFFYDNPLESMGEHERAKWFGCACCPGNVTRFMASVSNYIYGTQGKDVYVNLYAGSEATIDADGNKVTLIQSTDYPLTGNVKLTVKPDKESQWVLRLRIPGWTGGRPLATDLYEFMNDVDKPIEIMVNGRKADVILDKGYACVERKWRKGDVVELRLPMDVRRVKAHENVIDDRGKNAVMRGPLVYCMEEADQPDLTVFNKFLPANAVFSERFENDLLGGVMVLTAGAREIESDGTESETVVTLVPYNVWNNRGAGEMAVWIADNASAARAVPEPTVASRARMFSEPTDANADEPAATSNLQWAWGYNDLWEPKSSSDTSKPYHYWWLRRGTKENVCYGFEKPETVSSVDVYWLDFDHYDGNFRVPESWRLYYKDENGRWEEVIAENDYGTEKDCWNTLRFAPVTTTALKIEAQLRPGESGGVIEWKVE